MLESKGSEGNFTPWILLSTQSKITSMNIKCLTGGSTTHCGTGIESFQIWKDAMLMRLLWVRVESRRNTGIKTMHFAWW